MGAEVALGECYTDGGVGREVELCVAFAPVSEIERESDGAELCECNGQEWH